MCVDRDCRTHTQTEHQGKKQNITHTIMFASQSGHNNRMVGVIAAEWRQTRTNTTTCTSTIPFTSFPRVCASVCVRVYDYHTAWVCVSVNIVDVVYEIWIRCACFSVVVSFMHVYVCTRADSVLDAVVLVFFFPSTQIRTLSTVCCRTSSSVMEFQRCVRSSFAIVLLQKYFRLTYFK